jgi:nitrogen fixation/metabolism regulation signal transduction histidine kinase
LTSFFDSLSAEDLLNQLGKRLRRVTVRNGTGYIIDNVSDLKAVVEQELYEEMTGRE